MVSQNGKWAITQIILSEILQEIENEFNKINIDFMPIKGAYLISTGLSEQLENRKISDLDILVRLDDLETASRHFINLPQCTLLVWYEDNYRPNETVLKYQYNDISYTIEIMNCINSDLRFLLPSNDLFERSVINKKNLYYPTVEDSLIIHICHLQSHLPFEFRETSAQEALILIKQDNFNWDLFWKIVDSTGMKRFFVFFLSFCNKSSKEFILPQKGYGFTKFFSRLFTIARYNRMPSFLKRIFLDVPFTRKPFKLILQKILIRNYEKKRLQSLLS